MEIKTNECPLGAIDRVEDKVIEIWKNHGCKGRTASFTKRDNPAESFLRVHLYGDDRGAGNPSQGGFVCNHDFHIDYMSDAEGNVVARADTCVGGDIFYTVPAGSDPDEREALEFLASIKLAEASAGREILRDFDHGQYAQGAAA